MAAATAAARENAAGALETILEPGESPFRRDGDAPGPRPAGAGAAASLRFRDPPPSLPATPREQARTAHACGPFDCCRATVDVLRCKQWWFCYGAHAACQTACSPFSVAHPAHVPSTGPGVATRTNPSSGFSGLIRHMSPVL